MMARVGMMSRKWRSRDEAGKKSRWKESAKRMGRMANRAKEKTGREIVKGPRIKMRCVMGG